MSKQMSVFFADNKVYLLGVPIEEITGIVVDLGGREARTFTPANPSKEIMVISNNLSLDFVVRLPCPHVQGEVVHVPSSRVIAVYTNGK